MLEHGGHILDAANKYKIPTHQWLDLSTGINPQGWPIPAIPVTCWQRLPETSDQLIPAAQAYYQSNSILSVAGSQAAIQTLPLLRQQSTVGVLPTAYAEHAYSWKKAGHDIIELPIEQIDRIIDQLDVLILINPNNPTGQRFSPQQLLSWHRSLSSRQGWLIIDEAFMDTSPENSLSHFPASAGLIILRSIGKFFGLAGIRCGFVIAQPDLLHRLNELLGPWAISHPSRYIATLALQDRTWQKNNTIYLQTESKRLHALLCSAGLTPTGSTDLFHWVKTNRAEEIYESLAKKGILCRLFIQPLSLRFGLPANEQHWFFLEKTLKEITKTIC